MKETKEKKEWHYRDSDDDADVFGISDENTARNDFSIMNQSCRKHHQTEELNY